MSIHLFFRDNHHLCQSTIAILEILHARKIEKLRLLFQSLFGRILELIVSRKPLCTYRGVYSNLETDVTTCMVSGKYGG